MTTPRASTSAPPRHRQSEYHRMACPHCEWPAVVRTSQVMSNLTRQSTYNCTNVECGHTFVARTEIVYTLSPSATPNPAVWLPISRHVRRDMLRDWLDRAQESDAPIQPSQQTEQQPALELSAPKLPAGTRAAVVRPGHGGKQFEERAPPGKG